MRVIENTRDEVADARACLEIVDRATVFVVDHYDLGRRFDELLFPGTRLYVNIVDDPDRRYIAHVIVNQNMGSEFYQYDKEEYAEVLAGAAYTIVRDQFQPENDAGVRTQVRRLLMLLGNASDLDVACRLVGNVHAVAERQGIAVDVVVSSACLKAKELGRRLSGYSGVALYHAVDDIASLMRRADLAVAYCGSTVWELAVLGIPTLLYCSVANHVRRAEDLGKAGICVNLGWVSTLEDGRLRGEIERLVGDRDRRAAMSRMGRALIDGLGKHRLARAIMDAARQREVLP
jgi:spore coat polysaccharide biosynthesis predicted glycosyltransferase SpsG